MESVPIRELQQHASKVVRRVRSGETVGVTDRGELVAVIAPPSTIGGAVALVAAGRVRRARRSIDDIPAARSSPVTMQVILDDLRSDG